MLACVCYGTYVVVRGQHAGIDSFYRIGLGDQTQVIWFVPLLPEPALSGSVLGSWVVFVFYEIYFGLDVVAHVFIART